MPRHTKRLSLDDIPNASFWTVAHTNADASRFNTGADKTVDVQVMQFSHLYTNILQLSAHVSGNQTAFPIGNF